MEMKEKDVVKVIDEDEDRFFNHQGEIIAIHDDNHPEGPIEVAIEKLRVRYKRSGISDYKFRFFPEQLEKCEWSNEYLADRLFGKMWHSFFELKNEFNPEKPCMVEECENTQNNKSLVNYVGSVYEVYTCDECHEEWHGRIGESFPY